MKTTRPSPSISWSEEIRFQLSHSATSRTGESALPAAVSDITRPALPSYEVCVLPPFVLDSCLIISSYRASAESRQSRTGSGVDVFLHHPSLPPPPTHCAPSHSLRNSSAGIAAPRHDGLLGRAASPGRYHFLRHCPLTTGSKQDNPPISNGSLGILQRRLRRWRWAYPPPIAI